MIVAKAPSIARAADALLSGNYTGRAPAATEMRSLSDRLGALEGSGQANAALLKQIAEQIEAMTLASEVMAARQKWLLALCVLSLGLAASAIAIAFAVAD
jgi:hypothetical protein